MPFTGECNITPKKTAGAYPGGKRLVQIYEIQDPRQAERLIALGVDHIGSVILDQERWRDPVIRETVRLTAGTASRSSLIPLFSDPEAVARALDYYRPDILHCCENITPGPNAADIPGEATEKLYRLQEFVKDRFPAVQIMRSLPVPAACAAAAGGGDAGGERGPAAGHQTALTALIRIFAPVSDFFMTDTLLMGPGGAGGDAAQPVAGFVGITGKTCDWGLASWLVRTSPRPVILAGGLGPDNVAAAIARVRPAGVDSCTRTNMVDAQGCPIRFLKDFSKVQSFVAAARRAGAAS